VCGFGVLPVSVSPLGRPRVEADALSPGVGIRPVDIVCVRI
jgi:hypothetical protein